MTERSKRFHPIPLTVLAIGMALPTANSGIAPKQGTNTPVFDSAGRIRLGDPEVLKELGLRKANLDHLKLPATPVEGPKTNTLCPC